MNTVLLKFYKFALKPEVCEMGGKFWLQIRLNLLCSVCPSGQPKGRRMLQSQLAALYDFKICSQFSEIAIFE